MRILNSSLRTRPAEPHGAPYCWRLRFAALVDLGNQTVAAYGAFWVGERWAT